MIFQDENAMPATDGQPTEAPAEEAAAPSEEAASPEAADESAAA